MIRKVLLIRNVAPDKFGGAEMYQLKLAEILKRNGFEPVVVTASDSLLFKAKEKGFRVVRAPWIKRQNWSGVRNFLFPLYVLEQMKLRKWYKKLFLVEKPAVINVQSKDEWIAATRAAEGLGVRILWTDHADFRSWVLVNAKVKYKNAIGKWILKCARDTYKIILISDAEKAWLDKNVGEMRNLEVIKNGVLDEYVGYKNEKAKEMSFCYVGRVVKEKGMRELVDAFEAVRKKYPEARLTICGGEGGEKGKEELKEICGDVVFDNIDMMGRVDNVPVVLAKNKTFVLPSYNEGMSLALVEAMMMGKMIITTDVGAAKEMIKSGEEGILVEPRDMVALASAMAEAIAKPKMTEEMGRKARKRFEKEFDFEEIFAKKMMSLYNVGKEK